MKAPTAPVHAAMIARLTLVALLLALLGTGAGAQERPNVIVLLADDLGYGDLGAYGSPDALTPHLDALAARGLRFTDFYAGGPICTPSRYAHLTGLHTFRNGDPELLKPLNTGDTQSGIDAEAVTVAEALRAGGYETAMIGKWHLGHGLFVHGGASDTEFHPLHHGFDTFFGSVRGGIDYNTHWYRSQYLDWFEDRRPVPEDTLRYATYVFGDRAVAFLDAHAGAGTTAPPFFLYLPFTAPHFGQNGAATNAGQLQLPIGREREYLSRFDHLYPDDDDVRKRYLAMLAVLDDEVGRIVEALDRNGLAGNTVVWFLSDNGGEPGYGGFNGDLRGKKRQAYEGGVRVPSFVVWPGRIAPGATAQPGTNVDLLPTLATLSGAPISHPVDGVNLAGFLLGGPPIPRGVAVPNSVLGDAYRLGRWKLVRRYDGNGDPRPAELYDLDADLAETTDLAAVYPNTVAALLARMPYARPPAPDTTGARAFGAPGPPGPPPPPTAFLRVLPNPSRAVAAVEVGLPAGGPVRVEAFDVLGRRLAVLYDGPLAPGVHRWALPAGPAGVVVVRAAGPFGALTTTATRLR